MKISGIRGVPDAVIDNDAIESMEVTHHAPDNGIARYEIRVTYRIPEAEVIEGEVIEDPTGSLFGPVLDDHTDVFAPQIGVNFVKPWTIVRTD